MNMHFGIILVAFFAASPQSEKGANSTRLDPVGRVHIPIGLHDSPDSLKTFVEAEGGFSPGFASFGVSYWIYDQESKQLHCGTDGRKVRQGLNGPGRLMPWTSWDADGVEVWSEICQADRAITQGKLQFVGARGRLRNHSQSPKNLRLFIAIRPIGPAGGPIDRIELLDSGKVVSINGHLAVATDPKPTEAGVIATDSLEAFATSGKVPSDQDARSVTGDGAGLLAFDIKLTPGESRQFRLVCPVFSGRRAVFLQRETKSNADPLDLAIPPGTPRGIDQPEISREDLNLLRADDLFYASESYWDNLAGRVRLRLPDKRWSEAFMAITSHLAMILNRGVPDVAVIHGDIINRNGVYVANVLQKAGRSDLAEPAIDHFLAQPFDHRTRPDAGNPGQILWLIAEQWQFARDRDWLTKVTPGVVELANMIKYVRSQQPPFWVAKRGRKFGGELLEANRVAFKPGYSGGFHPEYTEAFDLAGMRAATVLLDAAGQAEKSKEMADFADLLQASYDIKYGEHLKREHGSHCVLWPCRLYRTDLGLGFDAFGAVGPEEPAPGLRAFALATAHQGLLTRNRAAGHDTIDSHWSVSGMSGWYSLDEGTKSEAGGWKLARTRWRGDVAMPHGLAMAEFFLLLRDSLVFEDDGKLILLAGIPTTWLRDPKGFSIQDMPTHYGRLSVEFLPNDQGGKLILSCESTPPNGFRLMLPKPGDRDLEWIVYKGENAIKIP